MIRKLLAYYAKRSRRVQVQVALATLYGLFSIFGVGKSLLIINTMRKQAKGAKRARTSRPL